jgi:hypothetical protein
LLLLHLLRILLLLLLLLLLSLIGYFVHRLTAAVLLRVLLLRVLLVLLQLLRMMLELLLQTTARMLSRRQGLGRDHGGWVGDYNTRGSLRSI